MALWSMLGERGVDMLGAEWANDRQKQLKLKDLRVIKADLVRSARVGRSMC
jgi:hypothetical protein